MRPLLKARDDGFEVRSKPVPSEESSVQVLFARWIKQRDVAEAIHQGALGPDDAFKEANATIDELVDAPVFTHKDFAAKIIAVTDHGAYMDLAGFEGGAKLVREAARIVGRTEHLEGGVK